MNIKNCLICGNEDLVPYLDLTNQPLANSYHHYAELKKYPLQVQFCEKCSHNMLTESVDPSEMFEHYLYVSDTSETLKNYFEDMADKISAKSNQCFSVLEIACNSGLFLEMLAKRGAKCLGVDPAKNLREMSLSRNLDVEVCFWNDETAKNIAEKQLFDVVIAVNVLPHVPDPVGFVRNCAKTLTDNGRIYIQTSQCDMFKNNEFDAVYHEHVSYFTAKSFGKLAESLGLSITDCYKVPIHSMSFVFELSKGGSHCDKYLDLVKYEEDNGYDKIETYKNFAKKAEEIKNNLIKEVNRLKSEGKSVVGYGASAKGNTLLNWSKIELDYIVDDNELKWGYLTPGQNIPIVSPATLYNEQRPVVILCLAWNFFDEIYKNVKNNTSVGHEFIKYFPEVKFIS